jgi:hypothetical protein
MLDFVFYLKMEVALCSETVVPCLPKHVSQSNLYIHCMDSLTLHMVNVANHFPCQTYCDHLLQEGAGENI